MTLSGNSRELSLADLIVVATQDPRSHRFTLSGPAGDGLLLIEGGRIVHATYGDLAPLDAAHVLVTEQSVDFEIEADAKISGHTLDIGAQELLMEAVRRLDEGLLKRPRQVSIEMGASDAESRKPHGFERRAGVAGDVPDVMMRRVGFGFRGSRLGRAARTILEEVANGLATTSDGVWIGGHEEPTENGANAELSLARAQSVAEFLEQLGIDPSRMVVDSRGVGAPVSSNRTAEGRRVNRRADIWILPEP